MQRIIAISLLAIVIVGGWLAYRAVQGPNVLSDETIQEGDLRIPSGQEAIETLEPARGTSSYIASQASSKEEAYSKLLPSAEAGNLEYLLAISTISASCGEFSLPPERRIINILPASIKKKPGWQEAYDSLSKFCASSSALDSRVSELTKGLDQTIERLAQQDDDLALLMWTHKESGGRLLHEDSILAEDLLRSSSDGDVLVRAGSALVGSYNEGIMEIDRTLFSPASSETERENVKRAAVLLLACDRGMYCGPKGTFQVGHCIVYGYCNVHVGLRDYLRRYIVPGGQFELASSYKDQLVARIY